LRALSELPERSAGYLPFAGQRAGREAVRLWRGDRRQAPFLPDVRRRQASGSEAPMVGADWQGC